MIRKTILITSIAILVAAISVATTMTMVQADVDGDTVTFTVSPDATPSPDPQVVTNPGIEYTGELVSGANPITVDINGDPDNEVLIALTNGSPALGDVVVEISDIQWFTEGPGAIGSFSCATDTGTATSAGLFDKDTLEITINFSVIDQFTEVHCEFEGFHGDVEKALDAPCEVQIMDQFTAECSFTITYSGVPANVIDAVPAEWEVTDVSSNEVDAIVTFTDGSGGGTLNTFIDPSKLELVITNAGFNVPTGGVFTFPNTIPIPALDGKVLFTDGLGAGTVDGTIDHIDELTVLSPGGLVGSPFAATLTATPFDSCVEVTKGNSGKAATGIECNDATDVNTTVTIETRKSPGKGHKGLDRMKIDVFKPTFCTNGETFPVNDGAQAILLTGPAGIPVLGSLDGLPIVLDFTLEELATSVDTGDGLFDCDGELKPVA